MEFNSNLTYKQIIVSYVLSIKSQHVHKLVKVLD
jgi:hypothetical protein